MLSVRLLAIIVAGAVLLSMAPNLAPASPPDSGVRQKEAGGRVAASQALYRVELADSKGSEAAKGVGLWCVVLAAIALVARTLAPALGLSRQAAAGLGALLAASFWLRAVMAAQGPLNYIEIERLPFHEAPGFGLFPLFAAPLALSADDPLALQSALALVLSALSPLLAYALATLWRGPWAGWAAAIALCAAPVQIRFAPTSNAGVAAVFFVLLALLACEALAQRPRVSSALAAGATWAVAVALRPDTATLLFPLALLILLDHRLRSLIRRPTLLAALLLPPLAAVAAAIATQWGGEAFSKLSLPFEAYRHRLGFHAYNLLAAPDFHPAWCLALGALGWLALPGWRRWVCLAFFILPPWTAAFGGHGPHISVNLRYALAAQAMAAISAGALVGWLASHGRGAKVVAVLIVAALAAPPFFYRDYIQTPSPLQIEHAALRDAAPGLPAQGYLLSMGDPRRDYTPWAQIGYRLSAAGREIRAGLPADDGCPALSIADLDSLPPALPPDCPVLYHRGWHEHIRAGEERLDDWRKALEQRFGALPSGCRRVRSADWGPRFPASMELCLLRLHPQH
jgi:hypothetical protein